MNGGLMMKVFYYNVFVEVMFEVIGGKWKVVILCLLKEGEKCFSEF